MPPQSNDSQGLKIAVAAFVTLSVILAVTTYFGFSSASTANEKLAAAEKKVTDSASAANTALTQYQELISRAGYGAITDHASVQAAIKKDEAALGAELDSIVKDLNEAVAKAQAGGEANPKFEELRQAANSIAQQYQSEPNKSYKDSLVRIASLLRNLSTITNNFALNDIDLRRSLTNQNQVNLARLNQTTDALDKKAKDLEEEHRLHESQRQTLNEAVDLAQTKMAQQSTEIANLQSKYDTTVEAKDKTIKQARSIASQLQQEKDKKDNVLDRPDGRITYVDLGRNEIRVNLSRRQGARPQMKFAIFDKNAAGVPSDQPKGRIELLSVGEQDSIARIETGSTKPFAPISMGDIVYSAAWSPGSPEKFALVGPIDINRDGKDDRADLIRLIEAAGGVVAYDLVPPGADAAPGIKAINRYYQSLGVPTPPRVGKALGELDSTYAYYVIDERGAFSSTRLRSDEVESADVIAFRSEKSGAIAACRENGIRPIPIDKLLAFLGYSQLGSLPKIGENEARDANALKSLLRPRNPGAGTTAPAVKKEEDN